MKNCRIKTGGLLQNAVKFLTITNVVSRFPIVLAIFDMLIYRKIYMSKTWFYIFSRVWRKNYRENRENREHSLKNLAFMRVSAVPGLMKFSGIWWEKSVMVIRLKKIDLMHAMFGNADGICAECEHFVKCLYHDRILRKCEVYGLTHSEATDWRQSYQACGLKNKNTIHQNVYKCVKKQNDLPAIIEGQVEMEADNE